MAARRAKRVTSLDLAKHLSAKLGKLVERRDRQVEAATGTFRLDMLAAIEDADAETIDLVVRGLKLDGGSPFLLLALQAALDERARAVQTRRSRELAAPDSDDAPIVISTPAQAHELLGDTEAGVAAKAILGERVPGVTVDIVHEATLHVPHADEGELRYPEPGEPAITLPDGTVVAA
jgi:hypothetical protein